MLAHARLLSKSVLFGKITQVSRTHVSQLESTDPRPIASLRFFTTVRVNRGLFQERQCPGLFRARSSQFRSLAPLPACPMPPRHLRSPIVPWKGSHPCQTDRARLDFAGAFERRLSGVSSYGVPARALRSIGIPLGIRAFGSRRPLFPQGCLWNLRQHPGQQTPTVNRPLHSAI